MYLQLHVAGRAGRASPIDDYMDEYARLRGAGRASRRPARRLRARRVRLLQHLLRPGVHVERAAQEARRRRRSSRSCAAGRSRRTTRAPTATLLAYVEEQTGEDLDDFLDAWLLGETTPLTPADCSAVCRRADPLAPRRGAGAGGGMRILVLGGTVFLPRRSRPRPCARGHEVVCACRGTSGPVPDGARLVRWDRARRRPGTAPRRRIRRRRRRGAAPRRGCGRRWRRSPTRTGCSCRPSTSTPTTPSPAAARHDAAARAVHTDEDPTSGPELYGAMKVGCEQLVTTAPRPRCSCGPG